MIRRKLVGHLFDNGFCDDDNGLISPLRDRDIFIPDFDFGNAKCCECGSHHLRLCTDREEGATQTEGAVQQHPLPCFAVAVRAFRPSSSDQNRASGEGRDGSDSRFFAVGTARRGGGCHTRCRTFPRHVEVAPVHTYPCGKAPPRASGRADERIVAIGDMMDGMSMVIHMTRREGRRVVEEAVFVRGYDAGTNTWDIQRLDRVTA